jgi:BirA family transcriptional regulator, biotin operon repressor / biotin---[acetyl-CoA-carboxylase] ligase
MTNPLLQDAAFIPLDAARIRAEMQAFTANLPIEIFDTIDSTNTYLMSRALQGAADMRCVAAEMQTAGRGRQGRPWVSVPGGSLAFSVCWQFAQPQSQLAGLSLAVGVAIVRALEQMGVPDALLKWPNDVLHHHRKLAGVLIETGGDASSSYAVIGVGMNVHLSKHARADIDQAVTDVVSITGQAVDRNILLAKLLNEITSVLDTFSLSGLASLRDEWLRYHVYQHKNVRLKLGHNETVEGRVMGIAADGALLIATNEGEKKFSVGDISLRLAEKS